jgi:DNA ligase-1
MSRYGYGRFTPVFLILLLIFDLSLGVAAQPELTLAKVYRPGIDLDQYLVSEKLDGVRAYWDGEKLLTRQGNTISAPTWFTADFPAHPLDGELWSGRGGFERLNGILRKKAPLDQEWRGIRYMLFELPNSPLIFSERYQQLQLLVAESANPNLGVITQYSLEDHAGLMRKLEETVTAGGEGLMLHRKDALYRSGRNSDLLKVKPYLDGEARVIGHQPGQGKYRGMLGSLLVEMPNGTRFRIGTGFSDQVRKHPPPIGSLITFKYHGLTGNGIPRFASYLRLRR